MVVVMSNPNKQSIPPLKQWQYLSNVGPIWIIHVEEYVECNVVEVVNMNNDLTDLCLFIVAAMENDNFCDLSSIYSLMGVSMIMALIARITNDAKC